MRHQEQQTNASHPEVIKSDPVPVPPPDKSAAATGQDRDRDVRDDQGYDGTPDEEQAVDDALDDRGTFEDPVVADAEAGTEDERAAAAALDDDATFVAETRRTEAVRTEDDQAGDLRAADAAADDRGAFDAPAADAQDETSTVNDRTEPAEPAPQPTVFGAATVGGATAAAAMAGYGRTDEANVRAEDTAATGDGAVDDRRDEARAMRAGFDQGGTGQRDVDRPESGGAGHPPTAHSGEAAPHHSGAGEAAPPTAHPDEAAPHHSGAGEAAPPTAHSDEAAPHHSGVGKAVMADAGGVADRDEPGQPVDGPAPAAELLPGDVPADPVAALFAASTAQGFRERWRDVQLRFVDDPRGAAGDAQALVEEAVDSLAATLAAQKGDLAAWQSGRSGDTEQLRVVVRRYRDFLDRLLGL